MAIDFPARHDSSSLNCRPGMLPSDAPTSMISVVTAAAAFAGMIMSPRAMYRAFFLRSNCVAYRLCRAFWVPEVSEF